MASPHYRVDICCPHCVNQLTPEREAGLRERARRSVYMPGKRSLAAGIAEFELLVLRGFIWRWVAGCYMACPGFD